MSKMYREKFGNDRFFVTVYPEAVAPGIGKVLGEAGVKYLDYGDIDIGRYLHGPPTIHAKDRHPTPEAYDLVASDATFGKVILDCR